MSYIDSLMKMYEEDANLLCFDWKRCTKTELANKYCDYDENNDTLNRDLCMSALMCKYAYIATMFFNNRKSVLQRLELDDFVGWVHESLLVGLKYRRWRDPSYKVLYENPNGAEVVFNRCFYSTEKRYYKYYNQECRKINYTVYSLQDNIESEDGDIQQIDMIADESNNIDEYNVCYDLVQLYIRNGQMLKALVIDGISYHETFDTLRVHDDECVTKESVFNLKKLIKHLNHLDTNFINYFTNRYKLNNKNNELLLNCVSSIATTKNKKLYNIVNNILESLKSDEEVKFCLEN